MSNKLTDSESRKMCETMDGKWPTSEVCGEMCSLWLSPKCPRKSPASEIKESQGLQVDTIRKLWATATPTETTHQVHYLLDIIESQTEQIDIMHAAGLGPDYTHKVVREQGEKIDRQAEQIKAKDKALANLISILEIHFPPSDPKFESTYLDAAKQALKGTD